LKVEFPDVQRRRPLWQIGLVFSIYFVATWFTEPLNIGDTPVYVDAIFRVVQGGSTRFWDQGGFLSFWEFGHLLWRPIGWLCYRVVSPLLTVNSETDIRWAINFTLVALNWLFGLLAVFSLHGLIYRLWNTTWAPLLTTAGFIFSNAFLNYAQSGCSYVPGLALLLVSLYLIIDTHPENISNWKACLSGIALAGSVGMWLPYFCAIPAVLISPLVLFRITRTSFRAVAVAAITCALAIVIMYTAAIGALGLRSVSEARQWVATSSHEVTENRGVARVVFGIPRSLINMGMDSVFFKRFLRRDPYNPVGIFDLARRSLWKLAFAYLFLLAVMAGLSSSHTGRRVLIVFLANAIPVVAFAWFFAGGVLERYFPLFSLIFIATAYCLSAKEVNRWLRYFVVSFVVVAGIVNATALSKPVVEGEKETTLRRVRELSGMVNPNTRIFVPPQDQLWGSAGRLQFEKESGLSSFHVDPVAILGTAQVAQWKRDFALQTLTAWEQKNDVWISRRFLSGHPKSEWNWTEGEDPRITWAEMNVFFARFETSTAVGGDDGFLLLTPTDTNRRLLSDHAARVE
jgi:hypothetical protein